ncbi:Ribokinase-like protein [Schizophyllum commune]
MSLPDDARFVTLGMFIIDEFTYQDDEGKPLADKKGDMSHGGLQIGGGGTYAAVGARIWLPPSRLGMVVDKGKDWPGHIEGQLNAYGEEMWLYRDQPDALTTRALNIYKGEYRGFEYLTPRIRITPRDLRGTRIEQPEILHFICSPTRASVIMSEVRETPDWHPTTIYEPIPNRCVPEELPSLIKVLPSISILSPNAEEAQCLLSMPGTPTRESVEEAAAKFLDYGIGEAGEGAVIIRSGALGAYVLTREKGGRWIEAYWQDQKDVADVTGGGNSFLGGLGAGLIKCKGDVYEATYYASVSASFIIQQFGLPLMEVTENGTLWNGESPEKRLAELRRRHEGESH